MDTAFLAAFVFLLAYLIGSIPFGYLVARSRGVDIFHHGSGNIGATNVGRVLGKGLGILVFLLDFAKGALPVALAMYAGHRLDVAAEPNALAKTLGVIAGLGAFLGHLFPIYLRFRGGKGVATGAGIIVVLLPVPAMAALLTWVAVVCATRYVSLASLSAAIVLCVLQLLTPDPFAPAHVTITVFCFLAALLIILRHRANVVRLLHGTENRIKDGPAMFTFTKTLHVLALGLWFGTVVFFTFVIGLTIFNTFESIGADVEHRPSWFPATSDFMKVEGKLDGPREQGTRAGGAVITPLFGWYFLLQGICGLLAVATALAWTRLHPQGKVHKVRIAVLLAALITVLAGWPLEQKVNSLRGPRYEAMDKFLQAKPGQDAAVLEAALEAKTEFGLWHMMSLFLNFGTVVLVGVAMALAAQLPQANSVTTRQELASAKKDESSGGDDVTKVLTHS
jgi:acyl-phosphate glycerol 3-phosphate acyltransferase